MVEKKRGASMEEEPGISDAEKEWNKGSEKLKFVDLLPQIPKETRQGKPSKAHDLGLTPGFLIYAAFEQRWSDTFGGEDK